jgi:hypothetical protein
MGKQAEQADPCLFPSFAADNSQAIYMISISQGKIQIEIQRFRISGFIGLDNQQKPDVSGFFDLSFQYLADFFILFFGNITGNFKSQNVPRAFFEPMIHRFESPYLPFQDSDIEHLVNNM